MINLKKVLDFVKHELKPNTKIVIGVSGGADSTCLLYLINQFKIEYKLEIIVAHINHGIRKESDEEEIFVKQICETYQNKFECKKLNIKTKSNLECIARKERYQFFEEVIKKYQADYLMTAHQADDLIETILMRITRGSTLKGYGGFPKKSKEKKYTLLRPLVFVKKEEIETFNKENKIEYRIDKSNTSELYTRNRFRKYVLPFLYKENKKVYQKFLEYSEDLMQIEEYLKKQTLSALTTIYVFDKVNLHELRKLDVVLQKRVLEYMVEKEYQENIHKITKRHLELIEKICKCNKPNCKINLPLNRVLTKEYDELYFEKQKKETKEEVILEEKVCWSNKETIAKIKETNIIKSNYILRLNSKEIAFPIKVRTRKTSDKIAIKNLNGSKKIKDIFINEKISLEKRNTYPIVVDAKDNILWIPGIKKSKFDKNIDEFYDIIYKYVISEEKQNEEK